MKLSSELAALLHDDITRHLASNGGNLCLSGAARGADTRWTELACQAGHAAVHWSFPSHHHDVCSGTIVALSQDQLEMADPFLAQASAKLGRPWPPRRQLTANLLRRNYFQVAWSKSVYAVADFDSAGMIKGGTAWAVQMFIDRQDLDGREIFVFDQGCNHWMTWEPKLWRPIATPPTPKGIWAGIGTRNLSALGRQAIGNLMALGANAAR